MLSDHFYVKFEYLFIVAAKGLGKKAAHILKWRWHLEPQELSSGAGCYSNVISRKTIELLIHKLR